MKGEVRMLKKFFLQIGVYGAEIAKEGFSGYVSEVLISYFGSFEKTIKKSQPLKDELDTNTRLWSRTFQKRQIWELNLSNITHF